ncbi:MAG TPA: hypothetical protein VM616_10360 [Gammaproteobacteria bacterium]|nr:hypothetical protein [Gammaproteobacteria bacterium]
MQRLVPCPARLRFLVRSKQDPRRVAVPGIGEDAFAQGGVGGAPLSLHKGGVQAQIDLTLTPPADMQDRPYLVELGRAAGPRLGTAGPSIQDLLELLPGG